MSTQKDAWKFFSDMQDYLNSVIPEPESVRQQIPKIVEEAKKSSDQRHKGFPEGAFLNEYVAPGINGFLVEEMGLNSEQAKEAFLSESFRNINDLASNSPARVHPHPFQKVFDVSASEIIAQWQGKGKRNSVIQSCPDMALRSPSPHKVVIEGKYFSKAGSIAAMTSLVIKRFSIWGCLICLKLQRILHETMITPASYHMMQRQKVAL
jgi:hypothetical protein